MSKLETYNGVDIYLSDSLHAESVGSATYRVEKGEYFAVIDDRDPFTELPTQRLLYATDLEALKSHIKAQHMPTTGASEAWRP